MNLIQQTQCLACFAFSTVTLLRRNCSSDRLSRLFLSTIAASNTSGISFATWMDLTHSTSSGQSSRSTNANWSKIISRWTSSALHTASSTELRTWPMTWLKRSKFSLRHLRISLSRTLTMLWWGYLSFWNSLRTSSTLDCRSFWEEESLWEGFRDRFSLTITCSITRN